MGNDDANSGEDDARPVWPAEVGTFYMARTETTRGQITLMLGGRPASWTASDRLGDEYPADRISWNDAKRCCQAVGALLGKAAKAVRLPYEAEWEYAARTGSVPGDLRESAHVGELDEAVLHPVAQKKRNRVGLHDLIGNVEEWVEDFYDRHAYSAPAAHGPSKGEERVKRGGTSGTPTDRATPTRRARARPDVASEFTGFRLVVEPGGSQ
jgi:formylglycine-generating enzyme required for sulfatase activity